MFGLSSIPRSFRAQLRLANLPLKRLLRFNLRLIVSRAVSLTLLLCLLTTSTPAAPQTVVAVAKETSISFYFWYQGSLLAKLIQGRIANARAQEKQEERDALVSRLQIYPGDVTIKLDESVTFAAVAYDLENASVGGVRIRWSAMDTQRRRTARISPRGEFIGKVPGTFTISAEGGGRTTQAKLIVQPTEQRRRLSDTPLGTRQVSTRDLPVTPTAKSTALPRKKRTGGTSGESSTRLQRSA